MSRLVFQVPSTLSAPALGKSGPLEFIRNEDGSSPLYAGYLHGTDAHLGSASAGAPRTDLSGNGRTLTQIGTDGVNVGQVALGFMGTGQRWLETPFTGDDLAAAGVAGELTVLHFAFHPSGAGSLWGGRTTGSTGARFDIGSDSTWNVNNFARYDTAFVQGVLENPIPAWRDTDYYMFGGSMCLAGKAMTTVRGHRGEVEVNGKTLSDAIVAVGGSSVIRIGSRSVNTPNTTVSVATLIYDRALTPAEVASIYAGMRALILTRLGIDV